MSKLRKFIVTPHLYWRDFLLKRNPDLAKRIYQFLKIHAPILAASVTLPKARKSSYDLTRHNRKIETLLNECHYVQAEDSFDELLKHRHEFSGQDEITFYRLYALCATKCRNWPLAAQRWQDCLDLEGCNPSIDTLYRLGESLSYVGDHVKAETFILKGMAKTSPSTGDFVRLHALYATVAEHAKDWPTAIERWAKQVDMKDENAAVHALCRLAQCQNRAGQRDEAEKTIHQAITARLPDSGDSDSAPTSAGLLTLQTMYAKLAESRKEWNVAAERWKQLICLEGSQPKPETYRNLIHALISGQNFAEVESVIRECHDVFPSLREKANGFLLFDHPVLSKSRIPPLSIHSALIIKINKYILSKGAKLIIMAHPKLKHLDNLSKKEISTSMSNNQWYILNKNNNKDGDLKKLYKIPPSFIANGIIKYTDYESDYVNFKFGFRKTTNNPNDYDYSVYFLGSSRYCVYSDDKNTIPSLLQDNFNKNFQKVRVINYSHGGARIHHHVEKIRSLDIKRNDVIFLEYQRDKSDDIFIENLCISNDIHYHSLHDSLNSQEKRKDTFIDNEHTDSIGNKYIADVIYNRFFQNNSPLELKTFKWAENLIQDIDEGVFFNNLNYQNNKSEDSTKFCIDTVYADIPLFDYGNVGSIVMNCNPITLGHLHLITLASQIVNHLYIFVVEEDRSAFPFADRIEMIRRATAHLKNVVVTPSGRFILSAETFPEYFEKDVKQEVTIDTSNDIGIFGKYVAKKFNISIRFVGEEPTDAVTRQYNEEMKNSLPKYGVQVIEIPRLESGDEAISASRVRRLLKDRLWDDIARICPQTTVDYLIVMDKEGRLTV